ncbi:hypothetical protein PENARI_c026G08535 [Penicillium arizonense]|uniref:Uncharacterized protein n=1 Tax=Penicillium arizonense TaxID=1835702 RepID=A0A1F5L6D0_PENAI|nr:hypothetical protein PENARI_c026G08535 [Penicillium arizonense]OGE48752.1 hypothetical protein PENARI_c026G08535 [Penicillium arizonense]
MARPRHARARSRCRIRARAKAALVVNIVERPCQRCFLRREKVPSRIPDEIKPAVDSALKLEGRALTDQIRFIRQVIKVQTKNINIAKRQAAERAKDDGAAAEQLQQSLRTSLLCRNESLQPSIENR